MSDTTVISAEPRDRVGKGSARAARREGLIPAVVYGNKKDPQPITVNERVLMRLIHTPGFFATLFDVEIGGETTRTLPRDVQFHPVTDRPEHIDFLRVSATTAITVAVPVEFLNEEECPGLRQGGVLNVVRYEIEVSCTPDKIPSSLQIDLATAEVGDSIHISAITLPDGVTPTITDRDFTVVTIAAPTVVQDEAAEAAAEAAEGEEGFAPEDGEEAAGEEGGESEE
ncbi:MAG: 50S ribosomal protein L25/general stress protein Ctc [Rhodospirillaceae bacterium]|nr:50S ribosomal protein L25/general stress protein Ctc [Rhodospirillaceae bacterium]